jgi:hypothetical protein
MTVQNTLPIQGPALITSATALAARTGPRPPAEYAPVDKRGGLLVAAEAVRIAVEFGLPEPIVVGVGPTGVIEAAMPMVDLLGWQKILDRPKVVVDERHGAVLVRGWFAHRQWMLRSMDA